MSIGTVVSVETKNDRIWEALISGMTEGAFFFAIVGGIAFAMFGWTGAIVIAVAYGLIMAFLGVSAYNTRPRRHLHTRQYKGETLGFPLTPRRIPPRRHTVRPSKPSTRPKKMIRPRRKQ